MIRVRAGGQDFSAAAFVFDKDGLMFESQRFWQELSEARMRRLSQCFDGTFIRRWAELFGVTLDDGGNAVHVDPKGILAVASPAEEIAVTAGMVVRRQGGAWDAARETAALVFRDADASLDLRRALCPRKGFPGILRRLRELHVPYGIATSDTVERAVASLRLFDDPDGPAFILCPGDVPRGKPHPDMLFLAAQRLGLPPQELVMVGDSYVDAEMAAQAGAHAIGVPESDEMRDRLQHSGAILAADLDGIEIYRQ